MSAELKDQLKEAALRAVPRFLMATGILMLAVVGVYTTHVAGAPHAQAATTDRPAATVDLTIVTGLGRTGDWPAFVPSAIRVPAHATVKFTVTNLDDATAVPAQFGMVRGTVGNTATVAAINPKAPNVVGQARVITSLDPNTQVGHTFTILSLGINVPIASQSVETFVIHTGAPGVYKWRCFDPCGMGLSGWAGPMGAAGYMSGTLTVG